MKIKGKKLQILVFIGILCAILVTVLLLSIPKYRHTIREKHWMVIHKSNTMDVPAILKEAGINVDPQDAVTTKPGDKGLAITIRRPYAVTLETEDGTETVYSFGETVGELLRRLQINPQENVRYSHPVDYVIEENMTLSVEKVEEKTLQMVCAAEYGTRYCYDPTMPKGETELLFYGVTGTQEIIMDAVYVGGSMEGMTFREKTVLTEPMEEIVVIGTGEKIGEKRVYPLVGEDLLVTADNQCLFYSAVDVFEATAYTSGIGGVGNITACGTQAREGAVAVDPEVVPYFTKMYIVSRDGKIDYGVSSAEDTGGAVKGKIIDLYFDTLGECVQFGRRDILVYFLKEGQVGPPVKDGS